MAGGTAESGTTAARRSRAAFALLAALFAIGVLQRVHGFNSLDLWFDDAWAAAPTQVDLGAALRMGLTAPGYTIAMREWLLIVPHTTWWAQVPAFVLSLAAIPAAFWLVRFLSMPRFTAVAASAFIALSPICAQYATRVKSYPFDLLAACAVLALGEVVRRSGSTRSLAALATASVLVVFVSASTAVVVAGVWIALSFAALARRETMARFCAAAGGVLVGCALVWLVFLRHVPAVLSFNWKRRGYLADYDSLPKLERTISMIFGGFAHGAFGYPVPTRFYRPQLGFHTPSAMLFGVAVLAVAVAIPIATAIRRREVTATLPAATVLALSVLLAFADLVPLGDGRTDEVLYAALAVCLAAVAATLAGRAGARARHSSASTSVAGRRVAAGALSVALLAGAGWWASAHQGKYPTISLRQLDARLVPLLKPGDVVFVDTFNSFGWCYYALSPCSIEIGGRPPWPQGFRPVSTSPRYFIASHYGIPQPELGRAQATAGRIWYVGYTYGTFDVGSPPALWDLPVRTYMSGLLASYGWRPVQGPGARVLGVTHTYALLLERR